MKQFRTFSSKLSAYIVGVSAVLLLCALLICAAFSLGAIKIESTKVANRTLNTTISKIETVLKEVEAAVDNMSWVVNDHIDEPDYMFHVSEMMVSTNSHIIGSAVAFEADFFPEKGEYFAPYSYIDSKTGEILSTQLGNNSYDYFAMEWYQYATLMDQSHWTEPYFDEGGGQQMMTSYSAPLRNDDGKVIGVITADVSLKDLTDVIESIAPFENSYTILLGATGSYLAHPDPETRLNETIFSKAIGIGSDILMEGGRQMLAGNSGVINFKDEKGARHFMVYGPLSNGWPAGIVCSYQDLFSGINKFMAIMTIIALLGILLLYSIDKKLIKRLTLPITEFAYSAQAIAKGNFHASIPEVSSKDEFMRLGQSLTYMEESINRYIDELRSATTEKQRFESELSIASGIQMAMLTKNFPKREGLDIFASVTPAKEVGGDLYDVFAQDDKVYFIVGDVSGKGVPAALFMAITRYAFHNMAKSNHSPASLAFRVNNSFVEGNRSSMFVTLFIGCIDLNTREMKYCNCGHDPIVLVSPDGHAEYIEAKPNLAAGLFEDFPYEEESMMLEKGSRIVIYTDGVTEAETISKDQFGEERLLAYCNEASAGLSSKEFTDGLLSAVKAFTGYNDQNDDITTMTILVG